MNESKVVRYFCAGAMTPSEKDGLKTTDTGRPMKNMSFECGIFCEERAV